MCVLGRNDWCTRSSPCFSCAEDAHTRSHPVSVDGCETCRLRSVQLAPSCMPSKPRKLQSLASERGGNEWERGTVKDARGMPLLNGGLNPISTKEYAEGRSKFEGARRRLHQSAQPESVNV